MSRTYRRTNHKAPEWVTHDWVRDEAHRGWHFRRYKLKGKELKAAIARYHSDATVTMQMCPAWAKRDLNRKHRAKDKAVLRKLNSDPEKYGESLTFRRVRKDALWNYW